MKTYHTFLLETLSADATAKDWIDDFVNSDNPKFAGKSKEERTKMALAAYYAKSGKTNESVESDALAGKSEQYKKGWMDARDGNYDPDNKNEDYWEGYSEYKHREGIQKKWHPVKNVKTNEGFESSKGGTFSINMKQFNDKWKDYQDNIKIGETIRNTNGKFDTLDASPYFDELNSQNIFYTFTPH